jgi:hypothetical protein
VNAWEPPRRRRTPFPWLAGAAAAVLLGIAAPPLAGADPNFKLGDDPVFLEPEPGRAVLYVAREQFARLQPLRPEKLHLDAAPLGILPQGGYLAIAIEPGTRCVAGIHGIPALCLEYRAGRAYLLRLREVIDEQDHLHAHWLLDDASAIRGIVGESRLEPVSLTERGRQALEKRFAEKAAARAGGPVLNAEPSGATVSFEPVLSQDLGRGRHSSIAAEPERPGRVVVTAERLQVTIGQLVLDVPLDSIETVRYGGTRPSGPTPWLNVQYSSGGRSELVAFADAREERAVETYNRLFAVLQDRWWARTRGGATSATAP